MKKIHAEVVAVSNGGGEDLSKTAQESIEVNFNGIVGDSHAGPSREAWLGDREPKGTILRNDRQWSAIATEELEYISQYLDLENTLSASDVGANLCLSGVPDLSLLPRGSRLKFPSGAALVVEEYNPPCIDMGAEIAKKYRTRSGAELQARDWLKPASGRRGLVGVIDVPGCINVGDRVLIDVFAEPPIKRY